STVGAEQHVDDAVRLLGGFDGVLNLQLAALVFAVGEQDHGFASDLLRQFVVRGQVDRIVKQCAFGSADGGNGAAAQSGYSASTAARGVDAGRVERSLERMHGAGEILQEIDIHIEAEDEGQVLVAKDLTEKVAAHLLFHIEH